MNFQVSKLYLGRVLAQTGKSPYCFQTIRISWYIKLIQNTFNRFPIASFHLRKWYRQRIPFHLTDIIQHIAGINLFSDSLYDSTRHRSSGRITNSGTTDNYDTRIFGVIGREITTKRHLVSTSPVHTT